jgi:hypothetical protein
MPQGLVFSVSLSYPSLKLEPGLINSIDSRYVQSHGLAHFHSARHPLALSYSDLSTWCHLCNEYVEHPAALRAFKTAAYVSKFGVLPPDVVAGSGGLDFKDVD